MDEAVGHAQIVRANAQKVGWDIFCYRQSLAENDAFLGKIENHGFAFLSLAIKMVKEKDWCTSFFFFLFPFQNNVINFSILMKGSWPTF